MRFNTRIAFAIGCVSLLAFIVPAFSVPAPKPDAKHAAGAHSPVQKSKAAHAEEGRVGAQCRSSDQHAGRGAAEAAALRLAGAGHARRANIIGTNPTARKKLWCATFMNFVLAKAGYAGTNSDAAKSFAQYGHRISSPQVGAIAVLTRGKSRRPCRRRDGHRCARQSDHHFRQSRPSGRRGRSIRVRA